MVVKKKKNTWDALNFNILISVRFIKSISMVASSLSQKMKKRTMLMAPAENHSDLEIGLEWAGENKSSIAKREKHT